MNKMQILVAILQFGAAIEAYYKGTGWKMVVIFVCWAIGSAVSAFVK